MILGIKAPGLQIIMYTGSRHNGILIAQKHSTGDFRSDLLHEQGNVLPGEITLYCPIDHDIRSNAITGRAGIGAMIDEVFGDEGGMKAETDGVEKNNGIHGVGREFAHVTKPGSAVRVAYEGGSEEAVRGEHGGECGGDSRWG